MSVESLTILVEGDTEQHVVKQFLLPFWSQRFTRCTVVNYRGSGNLVSRYVRDCEKLLAQAHQAVLILIDIKNDPYNIQQSTPSAVDAYQQLQQRLYAGLNRSESPRLGIFPVVVEIETWLLADPEIQRTLGKTYTQPEIINNPEEILQNGLTGYRKGLSARRYFEQADVQRVYADNCPHFILLADWLTGKEPTHPTNPFGEREQATHQLQQEYERLSAQIELNLKRGHTAAAGVMRTERDYIAQQIDRLWIGSPPNPV